MGREYIFYLELSLMLTKQNKITQRTNRVHSTRMHMLLAYEIKTTWRTMNLFYGKIIESKQTT